MYAAVRQAHFVPGGTDQVIEKAATGIVPQIEAMEGFVAIYMIRESDTELVTMTIFDNQAEAEESNKVVVAWLKATVGALVARPTDTLSGEVALFRGK